MRVAVDGFVPSMEEGNAGVSGDLFHCLTFWDPGSIPYLSDGLSRIPLTLALCTVSGKTGYKHHLKICQEGY